jgi:hypothetical protein
VPPPARPPSPATSCASIRSTAAPSACWPRPNADAARADGFLAIAVRRAPRDRLTRAAAIDRAFARGDVETGLLHLDALLRVAPGVREEMLQRLARLLEHEEIQAALLPRLEWIPTGVPRSPRH